MPTYKPAAEFLNDARCVPIIDVRAPIEYKKGHIPAAINLPLFDDDQRAEIGSLYRQQSRQESVLRALEIVGPKMRSMAQSATEIAVKDKVRVHCWRGGMRSRSVAWLLEQVNLETVVLEGGYKAFRKHVLESFKRPLQLVVLSGLTGAGKTQQLQLLKKSGEQVIDLEALANHRGSAFGGIGLGDQPTTEQFENELYDAMENLDTSQRIWVEDESRSIGSIRMPHHFFDQLRAAPALFMDVDRDIRRELIAAEYGQLPESELIAATERISKRMGGQNVKAAVAAIRVYNLNESIDLLLAYYDKLYLSNKSKMDREVFVDIAVGDPVSETTTHRLIELAESLSSDPKVIEGR